MKKTKDLRRILGMILTIMLVIGTIPIVSAAETGSEYEYKLLDNGTIELTSYLGSDIDVTIPENINSYEVSSISELCFFYKKQIQSIFISKNVQNIGVSNDEWQAFCANINLEKISVDADNQKYTSIDGVLYTKEKNRLIGYPVNKSGTEFIAPSSINSINPAAFWNNKNLEKLTFSGKLISIGHDAFSEMHKLSKFYYPSYNIDGVTSLLNECKEEKIEVYISKDITSMNDLDFAGSNVTIYVYSGSYGLEWAKEHTFPYVIMDDTIEDKETGITVSDINSDAKVSVSSSDDISSTGIENAEESFSISMLNVSEEIENVNISIPSSKRLLVCKKTSNGIEEISSDFDGAKISFETNSTSGEFVLYSPLWGDSNDDKEINIEDATIIQKFCSKKAELSVKLEQIADVNNDKKIDILDSTTIQKQIAKIK